MNTGPVDHFFSAIIAKAALTFVLLFVALLVGHFAGKRMATERHKQAFLSKIITVVLSFALVYFFVISRLATT